MVDGCQALWGVPAFRSPDSYNRPMQTVRAPRWFASVLLAWFALFTGAIAAAPWVTSAALERLCSAAGPVRYVYGPGEGDAQPVPSHVLDCPLCCPAAAPPGPETVLQLPVQTALRIWVSPAHAAPAAPEGRILLARGPPSEML